MQPSSCPSFPPFLSSVSCLFFFFFFEEEEMEARNIDRSFLAENFTNYKSSKDPSRIMFFGSGGEWKDFPLDQFQSLESGFLQGRTTVEVSMGGKSSVVEFLRMTQTDQATGAVRSVAWIDVEGRCFFPRRIIDGDQRPELIRQCVERNRGLSSGPMEECSDETSAISCERRRWDGAEAVSCGDEYYRVVERSFLAGMRKVDPNVMVTSINRCSFSGPIGDARRKGFWAMAEASKAVRGNANLIFGWFGSSEDGMNRILQHGFGQPDVAVSDEEVYGRGVRVARPEFLHRICELSEADDINGERHVLLCRVIAGAAEKVERGSIQCRPSSERYDSGVDDFLNPRWCIVWSTHMNTHVLPECVVSFRLSDYPQGFQMRKAAPAKKPSPPVNRSFSELLAEIRGSLPPSAMRTLDLLFDRYKAKKIKKDVFISQLRSITGNKLLIHAIKKIRDRF